MKCRQGWTLEAALKEPMLGHIYASCMTVTRESCRMYILNIFLEVNQESHLKAAWEEISLRIAVKLKSVTGHRLM